MSAFVVYDCPRCGVKHTTLECISAVDVSDDFYVRGEVFCKCRACFRSSVLLVQAEYTAKEFIKPLLSGDKEFSQLSGSLNSLVTIEKVISVFSMNAASIPESLPEKISDVLKEGNTCFAAGCYNAAGAMFRLALDLSTKGLLPETGEPNARIRRNLGLRLPWLFENSLLPAELSELAESIQQDGNDGAHDGTLSKEDALDLQDFAFELTRRIFEEPARLAAAKQRRLERRDRASND